MAGPADWGAVPADQEGGGPASWGAVPAAPQAPPPEEDINHSGYIARWKSDTGEFFHEGVEQAIDAPGNFLGLSKPKGLDEIGEEMHKLMVGAGASEEQAQHEVKRQMAKLQRGQGFWGAIGGPLQAITSPLLGAFRTGVSRPVEETTGVPKEATEAISMAALAAAGVMRAPVARVRVNAAGDVAVDPIGPLPKAEDFKSAAEVLGGDHAEANLKTAYAERGIIPAEAVHDAQRDAFLKHDLISEREPPGLPNLPNEFRVASEPNNLGTITASLRDANGVEHYRASITNGADSGLPGIMGIGWIENVSRKHSGLGPALYREIARLVETDGSQLLVGLSASEKATRVHSLLEEKGLASPINLDEIRPGLQKQVEESEHATGQKIRPMIVRSEPKPEFMTSDELRTLTESGVIPRTGLGADVTTEPPLISPAVQPLSPPGKITTAARAGMDQLLGLGRNIQFMLDPMATGSNRAMVIAKDAISSVRRVRWDWARDDADIVKNFDAEQLTRMWNAADEESVLRQEGKTSEHMGVATLTDAERVAVEAMHTRAQVAWLHAVDAGIVEGEGLPAYTPRMVLNVAAAGENLSPRALNELGRNVFTRTSQMLHRGHITAEETEAAAKSLMTKRMQERGASPEEIAAAVEKVKLVRNIRALPMAVARLQEAAIWREMINKIEDIGKATGQDLVADFKPSDGWFTIAGHPSFTKWRAVGTNEAGEPIMKPHPIYMPDEFKGPMTAILDESSMRSRLVKNAPSLYGALMTIKGKSMTAILNSPLIHNEVVWGKVAEAAGGREWLGFGLYFRGNKIVNTNRARAGELIERGLNPMGPRGAYQDITSMMEQPSLQGHQSWSQKVASAIMVPERLLPQTDWMATRSAQDAAAVERGIQKMGNFWHNTLLWDRVRDVQFGLADHLSDRLVAKGSDRLTADRVAAHFSNIIVGSIPKEAMSQGAAATANLMLFSRSFTLGNLSTFKQAVFGLPKPILAQIARDTEILFEKNIKSGAWELPADGDVQAAKQAAIDASQDFAKGAARRKAIATVALSAGFYYVGNALYQNGLNIAMRDSTVDEEVKGYARRYEGLMKSVEQDPFELRHMLSRLSPTYDNEPKKGDRVHIGYDKDGTAIYARNPVGKFGEEMIGYPTMPMEMVRRKLSPMAGGILEILENDKGFGRKIYDENDTTVQGNIATGMAVAKHMVMKHLPEGQMSAAVDLLRGEGDTKVNTLRTLGPALGFTASVGAPGGMARGEQLTAKAAFDARFNLAWPDIKKQIQRGDVDGARERMTEIGVPGYMQKGLIRNADNPAAALRGRTLRDFYQYSTPEQQDRFERAR